MQEDSHSGYQKVQSLLRYGAELAFSLDDHDLGHGVIDLCRTSRQEIETIGLKNGMTKVPIDSYEGMLLYRIMPEIARRLIAASGAALLLMRGERPGADITNIPEDILRRQAGMRLAKSSFGIISEKVRDRFDPEFRGSSTFYANEAISVDVRSGNILEVALNRVAPAPARPSDSDSIAQVIHSWARKNDFIQENATWTPDLPYYCSDMDNVLTLPEEDQPLDIYP